MIIQSTKCSSEPKWERFRPDLLGNGLSHDRFSLKILLPLQKIDVKKIIVSMIGVLIPNKFYIDDTGLLTQNLK